MANPPLSTLFVGDAPDPTIGDPEAAGGMTRIGYAPCYGLLHGYAQREAIDPDYNPTTRLGTITAAKGYITYYNPPIRCATGAGFSLQGIGLYGAVDAATGQPTAWIQVGWVKQKGRSLNPVAFVEFYRHGAISKKLTYPIAATTHLYRIVYSGGLWTAYAGVKWLGAMTDDALGFTAGVGITAGGECCPRGNPIGYEDTTGANKVTISSVQWQRGGAWSTPTWGGTKLTQYYGFHIDSASGSVSTWSDYWRPTGSGGGPLIPL